jgi:DNA-binding response OmpR family regulator
MWNRSKLVIADQDRHVRRLLCRVAQRAGLGAVPLADIALTLEVSAERQPDVIVLDVELSNPAGRAVLKNIKADARTRNIPVFIHTGSKAHSDRIIAFELGADDYFEKPCDLGKVIRRIQRRLECPRDDIRRSVCEILED